MRVLLVLCVAGCGRLAFDPLTDTSTEVRQTLQLDRVSPGEPLIDFPLPITLDESRADFSRLTADTLRVYSDAGDELPVEIEVEGPPLVAWVRVPRIEGTTTLLTIKYGGAPRGNVESVWDASYLGVWHMHTPGLDSSPFARASTATNITPIAGIVGTGGNYDRTLPSCLVVPSFSNLTFTQATLSGWIRLEGPTVGGYYAILERQIGDTGGDDFILALDPSTQPVGAVGTGTGGNPARIGAQPLTTPAWHHMAYSFTGVTSALYIDGVDIASGPGTGTPRTNARPLFIGCGRNFGNVPIDQPDGDFVDGILDEVRFESVGRSAAWIAYGYAAALDQVVTYGP